MTTIKIILTIILTIIMLAPQALWINLSWESAKDWREGKGNFYLFASVLLFVVWFFASMGVVLMLWGL